MNTDLLRFTGQAKDAGPGIHLVAFEGCDLMDGKFGRKVLAHRFRVQKGDAGSVATVITGLHAKPGTHLAGLILALTGVEVKEGVDFDLNDCLGKSYAAEVPKSRDDDASVVIRPVRPGEFDDV